MKRFHVSDVLSVTTGRLVSSRHMEGIYEILNFLTGDSLFTHQLPRAIKECEPWLRSQFPNLMSDCPEMIELEKNLDNVVKAAQGDREYLGTAIAGWVEKAREHFGLPEMVPVYEMGAEMHTRINPIEEAKAMFGDRRVISVKVDET